MDKVELYRDIAERTQGDIYMGVVGPVRTGKSTFIKRFMELLIIPTINDRYERERIIDELPQSGSGKTIMTTQPKFVPNEAVHLELEDRTAFSVRMVDCVGYMVPGALGSAEEEVPRMVRTPWYDYDIPFEEAAETGTRKVITDHSTIGIVVTTDGSITQLPRSAYVDAEERVINELKSQTKPFIIILNSTHPDSEETQNLRAAMQEKYGNTVVSMDVLNMNTAQACDVIEQVLMEFPLRIMRFDIPSWMQAIPQEHWLVQRLLQPIMGVLPNLNRMRDYELALDALSDVDGFNPARAQSIELGSGNVSINVNPVEGMFYEILGEECGVEIKDDYHLMSTIKEFVAAKREFDRLSDGLSAAQRTGYGLVPPIMDEMELVEPEIIQQGNRFGVRLKARASGLHMIKVDIETELSPLVGTEEQSEELVDYLMNTFEKEPTKIWQTNIFGKSLYDLVRDSMTNKVNRMSDDVQQKLRDALQRIVNDGCNNLICIMF